MQFQVPQFKTENKLIGPFTIAQFAYIGVAAIISFLLFSVLTTWFWLIISAVLISGALAMALGKVNGRTMPVFLSAMFSYLWGAKTLTIKPGQGEPLIGQSPSLSKSGLAVPPQVSVGPAGSGIAPPSRVSPPPEKPRAVGTGIESAISPTEAPVKRGGFAVPEDGPPSPSPAPQPVTPTSGITAKIVSPDSTGNETPVIISPAQTAGIEKRRSRLQSLFNKITTTSSPIPFREESLNGASPKGYSFIQKSTGETVAARRVDYR